MWRDRVMYQVTKRDGTAAQFEIGKISAAITKAFEALEKQYHPSVIDMLALRVTADFEPKIRDSRIAVEDIQDSAEKVLSEAGYADVAKAYILYRKQREKVRNVNSTLLNYRELVDNYLQINDWRVKENSTVTYSVGGLILSNSGAITANYWLSEIYDQEVANAHRNAEIHIHDLSMLTGYCAGWSLKQLIQEGLGGIPGKITSSPASHLSTLCNQMVNFLGIMQNEWAGAQAFSSFDTYLAPFVKVDHLTQKEVKQCIQSFVYGVNTPSRWGTQAPFSNITLDWTVPKDLENLPAIVGGREMDFTYGDCKTEMDMVNKAFIEIMIEGDANGRGFQYPIPTYSITRDFDWSETENNKLLFEMTAKYGTPYFSNYINSDMEPSDVRSMCCRLRLDLRELRKKSGGFFGSGESTGSVGVVTINLPRIAYLAKDESDFYQRLDKLMDIAARSLKTKRTVITKLLEAGLYPYTKRYLGTFGNHFSTIGLIGMNEVGLNAGWLRADLTHKETQQFTKDVLNHMRERLSDYQEQYGDLYNLEATPAESTTYRLAKHDVALYPDIITAARTPVTRLITPTPPTCRWATPTTSSRPWPSRMTCRPCTPPALCSTPFWVRSCRTGRRLPIWCGRSRRISGSPTTPCPPPTPSVRTTAISRASTLPAPSVGRPARCGAASPAITALSRTGTTARSRSSRTGRSTRWKTPGWRAAASATGMLRRSPQPAPRPAHRRSGARTACSSSPPRPAPTAASPSGSWRRRASPIR